MKQGKNQNIHFTWILALIFHLTLKSIARVNLIHVKRGPPVHIF